MVVQRRRKLVGGDSDSQTNTGPVDFTHAVHAVEEYSKHAEECRKLADLTAKPEDKRVFEDLAQTWKRLADLRKNEVELETKPLTFLGLCSHFWSHMWSHTSKH
jgi:hypothetical protein